MSLTGYFLISFSQAQVIHLKNYKDVRVKNTLPKVIHDPALILRGREKLTIKPWNERERASLIARAITDKIANPTQQQEQAGEMFNSGKSSHVDNNLVVFPSPNASTLINAASETVDLYTGKLNVSIPLYTLKSRELSLPIALQYNTSGIKVAEVGSWVGLGWSLDAGGVISRVMRMLPDEYKGNVTQLNGQIPAYGYLHKGNKADHDYFYNTSIEERKKVADYGNATGDFETLGGNPEVWDLQPDEFHFSFGGHSGKFVFSPDGNIHTIPYKKWDIQKTIIEIDGTPLIASFEITTEDGTKYKFGSNNLSNGVEESILNTNSNVIKAKFLKENTYGNYSIWQRIPVVEYNPYEQVQHTYFAHTSSWYLTKITSPNQDEISFSYEHTGVLSYVQSNLQEVRHPNIFEIVINQYAYFASHIQESSKPYQVQEVSFPVASIYLSGQRLSKITTSLGHSIEFIAKNPRLDLKGDKTLDEINIYDYQNTLIKSFQLNYQTQERNPKEYHDYYLNYFSNDPNQLDLFWVENAFNDSTKKHQIQNEHYRLFLKEIIEKSSLTEEIKHEFIYNKGSLPRRTSYKQDKWGYFSQNETGTTIPQISYTAYNGQITPQYLALIFPWQYMTAKYYSVQGAIVEPYLDSAKVGTLQKIIYPTGGAKEFFYELNINDSQEYAGGLRIKEVKNYPDYLDMNAYLTEKYTYQGKIIAKPFYDYQSHTYSGINRRDYFTSSQPKNFISQTKGSNIGYYQVEHTHLGFGKTVYKFLDAQSFPDKLGKVHDIVTASPDNYSVNLPPYPPSVDNDWKRGLMKEVAQYDKNGKAVSRLSYIYNFNPENLPPTLIYGIKSATFHFTTYPSDPPDYAVKDFSVGLYSYVSHKYEVSSIREELFNQNNTDKTTKITAYDYDIYYRQLSKQTQYTLGDPRIYITEYKYPTDYIYNEPEFDQNAWGIYTMVNKHMHSQVIEQTNYFLPEADKPILMLSSRLNLYKAIHQDGIDKVFPSQVLTFQKPAGIEDFKPSQIDFFPNNDPDKFKLIYDARYQLQTTFDRFDSYGNLLQKTDKNGLASYYKWSYQRSLPVATSLDRIVLFCDFEGSDDNFFINETFVSEGREGSSGINLLYKESSVSKKLSNTYIPKGDYTFSLWVKGEEASNLVLTYTIPNQAPIILKMPFEATGEDWQYISTKIPFANSATGISLVVKSEKPVVIDDILLHPEGSKVETYTYAPLIGMSSKTDANKQVSRFTYDDFNRLKLIKDHQSNLLQHYQYHYKMSD